MFTAPRPGTGNDVITVSTLNRLARELLEQSISLLWVGGEISNLVQAASGHLYFSLKDDKSQVRCVMFRHKRQFLDFTPENGMQVEVRALVTLYEPRGDFQINAETMRRAGLGALFEAFERLKARLEAEGLFDTARKRPLPDFPRQIGVVTSRDAAALRDVLTTLRRRMPGIPVVVYPTPVQGDGAAEKIAAALHTAGNRRECDVLILCRGGGSIEDLWQFNQEIVARAVADCPIPVVCGVGHETDFTIADFVADRRAPTPTAAAEMASPQREALQNRLGETRHRLAQLMERHLESRMQQLDYLSKRLVHPGKRLDHQTVHLGQLRQRLMQAAFRSVDSQQWQLDRLRNRLRSSQPDIARKQHVQDHLATRLRLAAGRNIILLQQKLEHIGAQLYHLNPQAVLERGYSIVRDGEGRVIRNAASLTEGNEVTVNFAAGSARTRVLSIKP